MSLIGKKAVDFTAQAVMPDGVINSEFTLSKYLNGSIGVIFFYPLDFTFVCPSEIIAFDKRVAQFEALGAKVIGVSIDSQYSHVAWRNTPVNQGGIGPVKFPLIADLTKNISRGYDVLLEDIGVALRATFIIDTAFNIRQATLNDLPLGRNIDETLRVVESLIFTEEHGEVCPAGWNAGQKGMTPTAEGVAQYLTDNEENL